MSTFTSVHVWDMHVDSRYMSARCFFCFHLMPRQFACSTGCSLSQVWPNVQLYNCNQLQEVGVTCRLVTALAAQLGLKFLFANIVEVKQLGSTSVWHRQRRRNKYRMIENIEKKKKKKKKYLNHHTVCIISLICTRVLGFSGCMHSTFTFRKLPSTDSAGISSFMKSSAFGASVISSSTELPAATIDCLERKESKEYGRNLPTKLTMMRAIAQT